MSDVTLLEKNLNAMNLATRRQALKDLALQVGSMNFPKRPVMAVNLHCHSFYSYNGEGLSPYSIVWMAKKMGLAAVGLVDFDVLDGVDELFEASELLKVPVTAGLESRCFLDAFASRELNSPGEPGVSYHMGTGFTQSALKDLTHANFFKGMVMGARKRNLDLIQKVNAFTSPLTLDFEADVVPLTPKGVATERHICQAYDEKARKIFSDPASRAAFWREKLGADESVSSNPVKLQALFRSKTMKKGGVGYQTPGPDTFPAMAEVNKFILAQGAIPVMTWLDGTSPGEGAVDELMDTEARLGSAALNIIPDRNWNFTDPAVKKIKMERLYEIVKKADERGWPIQVGTEMNAPGLKRVDDFDAPELAPVVPSFIRGSRILVGHTHLAKTQNRGYLSDWALGQYPQVKARNDYFEAAGRELMG